MEIYIFIGVFLLLITCIAPRDKTVFYFFCILFAMIGLFRSHNVGTDCIAYSSAFRKITLNPNTWNLILPFEPGFLNSIYLLRLCCCGVLCLRFIHLIWDVFSGNILQISILLYCCSIFWGHICFLLIL